MMIVVATIISSHTVVATSGGFKLIYSAKDQPSELLGAILIMIIVISLRAIKSRTFSVPIRSPDKSEKVKGK